ncbi:MAG: HAMP domain-containing sensor histidine kinase [Planctomycetota bacterium]
MDTLRVMVVDDEPGMQLGIKRVLRDFTVHMPEIEGAVGFEVEGFADGAAALDRIQAARPDILLLDHRLPDITGMEILDRLRNTDDSEMLVIMITAYASIETALSAAKRGAYDFLAKPFTPDELTSTVRKAAGRLILQRQAKRLAEEKRQVRFQFISVLAHELKAPLNAVEGYLRLVRDHTLGDSLDAYTEMVARSLVRVDGMRKLIFDLLDMTRIESGQKKRSFEEFDVRSVAKDVIETLSLDARDRGITVELHADGAVPVYADRGEINIVMSNLVSNALKYNRDGGRVDVALRRDGSRIVLEVTDTGIGLGPEEAAKLFSDFVRIKNEKTKNILGSGLGLSTVKKIATLYGGDVSLNGEPDKGSTFTVTLMAHSDKETARCKTASM